MKVNDSGEGAAERAQEAGRAADQKRARKSARERRSAFQGVLAGKAGAESAQPAKRDGAPAKQPPLSAPGAVEKAGEKTGEKTGEKEARALVDAAQGGGKSEAATRHASTEQPAERAERAQTFRDETVRGDRREVDHQLIQSGARADASGARPSDAARPPARGADGAQALPPGVGSESEKDREVTHDERPEERALHTSSLDGTGPHLARSAVADAPAEAGATSRPPRAEIDQVVQRMVRAVQVGEDMHARKTVLLDVEVPGRGRVHIRLRNDGDSHQLRMRAEDPDLARDLRAHRQALRERASERGLNFSRIDIVG